MGSVERVRRLAVADLLLLGTVALWALNFSVSKYLLDQGLHPLAYSGVRYAGAASIFVVLTLVAERSLAIRRRDWPLVAGSAVVLLSETITWLQVVGGVAIAAGILVSRRRAAPTAAPAGEEPAEPPLRRPARGYRTAVSAAATRARGFQVRK